MNKKLNIKSISHPTQKVLAMSLSAIMTVLICTSTSSYASDIDIYQTAKSGNVTLMMMIDISGSMGYPQQYGERSSCDIPSNIDYPTSNPGGHGSWGYELSTNGEPTYSRYHCTATAKTFKYKERSESTRSCKEYKKDKPNECKTWNNWVTTIYYAACTNDATTYNACTWASEVTTKPSDLPTTSDTHNSVKYYYTGMDKNYFDRITRVKDGMFDLLYGNTSKSIAALSDDKFIGLSTYSTNYKESNNHTRGEIRIPARRLDANVVTSSGTVTQRQLLLNTIAELGANGGTPTANAYADVAAYMMGTTTVPADATYQRDKYFYRTSGTSGSRWRTCSEWRDNNQSECRNNSWSSYSSTQPSNLPTTTYSCTVGDHNGTCYTETITYTPSSSASGFSASPDSVKNDDLTLYEMPSSLKAQLENEQTQQCSGQGIYVLTDGDPNNDSSQLLMSRALNDSSFSCSGSLLTGDSGTGWSCISNLAMRLLNKSNNPSGLKIKTAVVGFGGDFSSPDLPSYNKNLTQAQNLANIDNAPDSVSANVKNAARWGVYAEGGWYSGSSSDTVVESVNSFLNSLASNIPAVTTGTPTIPLDQLNPAALQNYAYYPQFQPTPDKSYQMWIGNLKKYSVHENGYLLDKKSQRVVDAFGKILNNYDLWSSDVVDAFKDMDEDKDGSDKFALMGGVKAQLLLKKAADADTSNRKLLTNRTYVSDGTDRFKASTVLRQVDLNYLSNTGYSEDPSRGYLVSLLGYAIDAKNPNNITQESLQNSGVLRQIGAVMHSSPILLTNKGKITYTNNVVGSEGREDYIAFGTTQGLLHVVDAVTGKEKFAFVPHEMVENQKEAFSQFDTTEGGMKKLFYGVDGPWTSYTEYVLDANENLTVGDGTHNQVGDQMLYGGLRMGGRSYYALDLKDIDNPALQFQIDPNSKSILYNNESKVFNELKYMGQSWSKPTIAFVNWKGVKKRVMLVGGGYDAGGDDGDARTDGVKGEYAGYESDAYAQTNKKGAGVYMFDADNGDLLWWASANVNDLADTTSAGSADKKTEGVVGQYSPELQYSVVSQIKTVDRNSDGLIDHIYFGDLGGQLFRIDFNNTTTDLTSFSKTPARLLNLNNGSESPRFYEAPSFSTYSKNGVIFAVVAIGSGNRSKPMAEYTVNTTNYKDDAIYNVYDKDVARKDLFKMSVGATPAYIYDYALSNLNTENVVLNTTTTPSQNSLMLLTDTNRFGLTNPIADFSTSQGWFYKFESTLIQSEKVMSTPIVINNDMYVTTFDGSKKGLSGDCGAGVKGESFMTLFCMPYGQCASGSVTSHRLGLGAGIVGGAIGAGDGTGMTRLIVANVDASGISGNAILDKRYNTGNKLIPQRWYDKR